MNGQQEEVPFIGYNSFLSIPDIIETWSMMNELFEGEEQVDWVDEDRIKPLVWSKKWIPFTDYEASSRLIGMSYQEVTANSFEEFSNEMLKRLQANQFSLTDDVIAFDDFYFV